MQSRPLAFASNGENVTITDIHGGEIICKKLKEMGFINGKKLKIVKNDVGPMIVKINESRIILGRGMAVKIMVNAI